MPQKNFQTEIESGGTSPGIYVFQNSILEI